MQCKSVGAARKVWAAMLVLKTLDAGEVWLPMETSTSFINPASIQAIAHSIDVTRLSDDAAGALSPDVDFRLREVIQAGASSTCRPGGAIAWMHDEQTKRPRRMPRSLQSTANEQS